MKFICMGYFDPETWQAHTPEEGEAIIAECFSYDDELRLGGYFRGGEAMGDLSSAVTLRHKNDQVEVTDGPYIETKEILGGILLLEASDLNEAIRLVSNHPGLRTGPFEIRPADENINQKIQESNAKIDRARIRKLIERWSTALENKDLDGICANYTDETVLFDAIPPYKVIGTDAIRETWEACLPYFPDKFKSEHQDLTVHVAGETAFVCGLHHFITADPNHSAAQTWMRVTIGFEKINGLWKVTHEHVSVPFNPMDNKAWFIKDPENIDAPDYSQA